MYLRTLDLHGFKCFGEPFTIEFHDGLNVLVGENGRVRGSQMAKPCGEQTYQSDPLVQTF